MSHAYILDTFVLHEIPSLRGKIILDLGCGKGLWGYLIKSEKEGDLGYMIGLDVSKDYLIFVKKHNIYDDLVLASASALPFRDKCIDIILASEVIEHLPKSDGLLLLVQMQKIAREKIIITTPNGFLPTKHKLLLESHKSGWYVKDFRSLGYKVRGIGFRFITSYKAFSKPYLHGAFRFGFTPFSYVIPELGEFLVAVKELKRDLKIKV